MSQESFASQQGKATRADWTVRHGDSSISDVWAVLEVDGSPIDLADGWVVRAQARDHAQDPTVAHEFPPVSGIDVSSAQVRLPSGRTVTTSTVQLMLNPADHVFLPRDWSGVFDVQIELPHPDEGQPPQRRYTVVDDGHLTIVPDVTR